MTLLEYLDRMGERNLERARLQPRRPADVKAFIGLLFLAGYYVMVWRFQTRDLPTANLDLIRDAMLTLGPPVGIIVGALFRSDIRDEMATQNTARFANALGEQAKATQAAAAATPASGDEAAASAARETAEAANEKADEIADGSLGGRPVDHRLPPADDDERP